MTFCLGCHNGCYWLTHFTIDSERCRKSVITCGKQE